MERLNSREELQINEVNEVQQPGEITRPIVGEGSVEEIVKRRYGLTVTDMKELNSYIDRNYYIQVGPHHSSPTIQHLHPHGYVVKIYNSKDSLNPKGFEFQHEVMACMIKNGIPTQHPVLDVHGRFCSLENIYQHKNKNGSPIKCMVEMRTFIPGRVIAEVPYTISLLIQTGRSIANMTNAFKDLNCVNSEHSHSLWALTNVPLVTNYTFCLQNDDRKLVEDVVSTFNAKVVPQYRNLPPGYIHGDTNHQNILVSQNASGDDYDICGILDFADGNYSYTVMDLAINISYMMIDSDVVDQLDTPGYILTGYQSVRSLTQEEWDVLVPCVAGRLAQHLTLSAHMQYLQPENAYLSIAAKKGWPLLKMFHSESDQDLVSRWKTVVNSFQQK